VGHKIVGISIKLLEKLVLDLMAHA